MLVGLGAPHGGAALMRRTSVFARGENLGAGGIHFRRALKCLTVTKKKDTLKSVSFFLEQVKGIEPSCSAWEADILPLNYTCMYC